MVSSWDWSTPTGYMHDLISTDRRNPTVNAYGKLYGAPEESTDFFPVLDPKTHTASQIEHPVRDPKTPSSKNNPMAPSPFWGPDPIWDSKTSIHNQMMDEKGRVWSAARVRPPANPDFCKAGSDHPSAKILPLNAANRHASMYDPQTGKFTLISTCFPTHHLAFAEDANNTLWFSSGVIGPAAAGFLNRKMYEETGDEEKSQGWTVFVLDTNGNGRRDEYVEPNQPVDAAKDKRIETNLYSVAINPQDGSVWGTRLGYPGHIVRLAPGPDPTHTALAEIYEPPFPGYGPRGGDIGRDGIYWASLASGHLGRFDRSKCKVLNGPTATGKHCPEGWTLYKFPGPQFKDVAEDGSVEASYYTWVDQHNTFGLGANVPIASGNMSDAYFALVNGQWVTLRVPYPMGFFAKWSEGRIDDPNGGWKGKGLWATSSTRTVFHFEGGTKNKPQVVRFQLRPDPLARRRRRGARLLRRVVVEPRRHHGAADHARKSQRGQRDGGGRDAAQSQCALADLAPQRDLALGAGAFPSQLVDRGQRLLAQAWPIGGLGGRDYVGQYLRGRLGLVRLYSLEHREQLGIARRVVGERHLGEVAHGQPLDVVALLRPRQHREDTRTGASEPVAK